MEERKRWGDKRSSGGAFDKAHFGDPIQNVYPAGLMGR